MTFSPSVWMVDGNTVTGNFARLMQQSTWDSNQGVMNVGDLYVSANSTPNSGIQIANGCCVINGIESTFQGSYFGENVGTDSSLTIASTSSTGRSDMIVARAEDWTFSGTPWTQPGNKQVVFPRVISGVTAGSTAPPGSAGSCIPLARIDIPASTSAITNTMIHDLRYLVNPRNQPDSFMLDGLANGAGSVGAGTAGAFITFPASARPTISIPTWAVAMKVDVTWTNIMYSVVGGTGAGNAGIQFRTYLNGLVSSTVNFITNKGSGLDTIGSRHTVRLVAGDRSTFVIPAAMRGTTQNFYAQAAPIAGYNGQMAADSATTLNMAWQFFEAPIVPGT